MENEPKQPTSETETLNTTPPPTKPKHNKKKVILTSLLIVLVLAAFGGLYYWQNSKNQQLQKELDVIKAQLNTAPAVVEDTPATTGLAETDKTANWLAYTASGYTIKLADGWVVMKKQDTNDSFFSDSNDNLEYKQGVKAVMKDYVRTGHGEFRYGLYADYSGEGEKCSDTSVYSGYKLAFKTTGGNDAYSIVQAGNRYGVSSDDKVYGYCIQLNGSSKLVIGYTVASGDTDNNETLKEVIQTIAPR